jgi:hypothetical protein
MPNDCLLFMLKSICQRVDTKVKPGNSVSGVNLIAGEGGEAPRELGTTRRQRGPSGHAFEKHNTFLCGECDARSGSEEAGVPPK